MQIVSRHTLEHLNHGTEIPVVLPVLFNGFINLGDDISALSAKVNIKQGKCLMRKDRASIQRGLNKCEDSVNRNFFEVKQGGY